MKRYQIVLISVSKQSLANALGIIQESLRIHHLRSRRLKRRFKYTPVVEIRSCAIKRTPTKRAHFSVIRSPFVFKKSGETFISTSFRAAITISVRSALRLSMFSPRGILRFLLRDGDHSAVFANVELRVVSIESSDGTR